MSSVQHLREFIRERLHAAADEIFSELEKTFIQYEEEIDRQRKLLDITWKPKRNVNTAEIPRRYVCKVDETVQDDQQQLCKQELNSDLEQEKPEFARIKEEEEELLTCKEEELLLKEETDYVSIPAAHENDHNYPKLNGDHIPSYSSPVDDDLYLEGKLVEDSGPAKYADEKPQNGRQIKTEDSSLLESHCNTHTAEEECFCSDCGKSFSDPSSLRKHNTIHEKQFCCKTCGETFNDKAKFTVHVRFHTIKNKTHSCQMCGKCFGRNFDVVRHMKSHTGEKPYSCKTCGKCFHRKYNLVCHMRTHTGEKPYSCKTCGKCFRNTSDCVRHMKIHTGEKPFSCKTCGKCFHRKYNLEYHIRTHMGEKPYSCKTWKKFSSKL